MKELLENLFYLLIFPGGVFAICMAMIMAGLDRKLVARMQLRQGPPLIQPIYDTIKLFGKEIIIPKSANEKAFVIAPFIGLASILVAPVFIPVYDNTFISTSADVIVLIYLLTIPAACLVIGGSSSGSFFGGIGASREVVTMIAYELPMVMAILSVCKKAGLYFDTSAVYSLEYIEVYQILDGMGILHPSLIPAAIAFLMVIPAEVGVVPFDMAEAETELCEGPLVEYSGPYLAIYKLTSSLKAFVMCSLFVALFLGGVGLGRTDYAVLNILINILLFVVLIFIVMFISITLVRSVVGRLKINQGLKFYWIIPSALALFSFILVMLGI